MRCVSKAFGVGVLAITACASTATSTSGAIPTVSAAPPPDGWWMSDAASRAGEARRFLPTELQVVSPDGVDRVRTELRAVAAPDTWAAQEPRPFSLHRDGATLVLSEPPRSLTLRPATPDEAASADAALARHGTIDETCARAARCFHAAAMALSPSHDDAREMAPGTHLLYCEHVTSGYVQLFTRLGRTVPAACAD